MSLKEWFVNFVIGNNATLRLVTGLVFLHENDFNEALKTPILVEIQFSMTIFKKINVKIDANKTFIVKMK